jgi:glycosyltransferase involved in cell wall biosynthesis
MGYPVVSILHNYLKAIDLSRLGTNRNLFFKVLFNLVDPIIMKLIFASSKIFVMSKEYFMDLDKRFRSGVVEYIEQDLWDVPSYVDVNLDSSNILIFGVFGTYKKLELLLDLLPEIHSVVPKVRLIIAGQSHPEEPSYLNKTMIRYSNLFESGLVTYRGYVEDADLANLFHEANVVVLTNSLVAGSSSALRFSSSYGRGVIVPDVDEYGSLNEEEWGILKYSSGNKSDFMKKILNVLNSKELQIDLSKRNYHKAISKKGDFLIKHQRWFQVAHRHNSNKSLVKR